MLLFLLLPAVGAQMWGMGGGGQNNGGLVGGILGSLGLGGNQQQAPGQGGDVLGDLTRLLQTGDPGNQMWQQHAQRFCQQYPQHPKCQGGALPQFSEIQGILSTIGETVRQIIPVIPRINIRDPLLGVPPGLANLIDASMHTLGFIPEQARRNVKNVCKKMKCKEKKKSHKDRKNFVKNNLLNFERRVLRKDTSNDLDLRLQRTRQVKQALLEQAGIGNDVTAADDGVFDKDILLTTEQADFLLNEMGKGGVQEAVPQDPGMPPTRRRMAARRRFNRASLFFEEQVVKKWDLRQPILYTFHESLEEWDKNDVRAAIAEIQQKVPCIRFSFVPTVPNGPHLHYMKVDNPTFCGLSYIGRTDGGNPIYLSFQCGNARGVAVHETMHALGVNHQHLRMDRDKWLTVDWSNINPQHYDMFAVADGKMFTSYGVQYDYGSIMHYNAYTAAVDISKPTMIPKLDTAGNMRVLGQRDAMSARDVEILQKMYCKAANCVDTNVYCGAWALQSLCGSASNGAWMQQNCRKSCNMC